jgi:hypothetical protein
MRDVMAHDIRIWVEVMLYDIGDCICVVIPGL